MDKKFNQKRYGMMVYPLCDGYGHIRPLGDFRVCQNCGGFGFIREEVKSFDQKRQTNRFRWAVEL